MRRKSRKCSWWFACWSWPMLRCSSKLECLRSSSVMLDTIRKAWWRVDGGEFCMTQDGCKWISRSVELCIAISMAGCGRRSMCWCQAGQGSYTAAPNAWWVHERAGCLHGAVQNMGQETLYEARKRVFCMPPDCVRSMSFMAVRQLSVVSARQTWKVRTSAVHDTVLCLSPAAEDCGALLMRPLNVSNMNVVCA